MSQKQPTINEVKQQLLAVISLDDPILTNYAADERKGVQRALKQTQQRIQTALDAEKAFQARLRFERRFWSRHEVVAGVDEVGRGPLAGPVITAAVILPHNFDVPLVNDSKQLTEKTREALYPQILAQAEAVSIGVGSSQLIDQINIYEATRVAMKRAVDGLAIQPTQLIVDAMNIPIDIDQTRLIKGDAKSASVSAASIVAKVYRDHLMATYDQIYPGYGFASNAGYGTKTHLLGLANYGVTPIHRKTFEPVKKHLHVGK
ncbi:ribonuclease HII [Levilactobacillus bambusae]|uniref:Ribonuclease HII n=1 Tax=Levilactobacillus bambusae TaxID=2024736 RepID=A0A2V1N0P0_9LACO|nr:ribonuclease HII [Levilactobacillus bambusae]PWG00819.1 ribonuclease HII [Levilactobacillus bambusae]